MTFHGLPKRLFLYFNISLFLDCRRIIEGNGGNLQYIRNNRSHNYWIRDAVVPVFTNRINSAFYYRIYEHFELLIKQFMKVIVN